MRRRRRRRRGSSKDLRLVKATAKSERVIVEFLLLILVLVHGGQLGTLVPIGQVR
jgi:hypothetical protein